MVFNPRLLSSSRRQVRVLFFRAGATIAEGILANGVASAFREIGRRISIIDPHAPLRIASPFLCSPEGAAVMSACAFMEGLGRSAQIRTERAVGDLVVESGLDSEQVRKLASVATFPAGVAGRPTPAQYLFHDTDGSRSRVPNQAGERGYGLVYGLMQQKPGQTIIAITHECVIETLLLRMLGENTREARGQVLAEAHHTVNLVPAGSAVELVYSLQQDRADNIAFYAPDDF